MQLSSVNQLGLVPCLQCGTCTHDSTGELAHIWNAGLCSLYRGVHHYCASCTTRTCYWFCEGSVGSCYWTRLFLFQKCKWGPSFFLNTKDLFIIRKEKEPSPVLYRIYKNIAPPFFRLSLIIKTSIKVYIWFGWWMILELLNW